MKGILYSHPHHHRLVPLPSKIIIMEGISGNEMERTKPRNEVITQELSHKTQGGVGEKEGRVVVLLFFNLSFVCSVWACQPLVYLSPPRLGMCL